MILLKTLHFLLKIKNNEIENIFLYDDGNSLKVYPRIMKPTPTQLFFCSERYSENKKLLLLNGQIINSKKDNMDNEVIEFSTNEH